MTPNRSFNRSANGRPPCPRGAVPILRLAGKASIRLRPVNSATRASPSVKQYSSRVLSLVSVDASDIALNRSWVRTGSTTSGHRRSSSAADPDARRARGPHSLAEVGTGRLLELIRYSPHRSNLDASTLAVTRRCIRSWMGLPVGGSRRGSPFHSLGFTCTSDLHCLATFRPWIESPLKQRRTGATRKPKSTAGGLFWPRGQKRSPPGLHSSPKSMGMWSGSLRLIQPPPRGS